MLKFARLLPTGAANTVIAHDVIEAENAAALNRMFHPDIRAEFVSVPAATVNGSTRTGATWTHPATAAEAPPAAEPEPARRTVFAPPQFLLLFTPEERLKIRAARAYKGADAALKLTQAMVDDWLTILEDPRLVSVDLNAPAMGPALQFMVDAGLIDAPRKAEILLGTPA